MATKSKPIPIGEEGLRARLDTAYREADRILVTISSGVLALSVPLASKSTLPDSALWIIRIGWLFFLITILIVLRSLYLEQIEKTERIKADGFTNELIRYLGNQLAKLNKMAIWFFALGLIDLMAFLIISTWK